MLGVSRGAPGGPPRLTLGAECGGNTPFFTSSARQMNEDGLHYTMVMNGDVR